MTPRTSRTLLACFVLLALAFAGWSVLRDTGDGIRQPLVDRTIEPALPPPSRTAPILPAPSDLGEEPLAAPAAESAASEARVSVATEAERELADAMWVSGRLVFPEGTPIGETVEITASGRAFQSGEMHRARADAAGNFRVALAPGTRAGTLWIDAPHLFLPEPVRVKFKKGVPVGEVVLEPLLGARVFGQIRLPAGASDLGPELVGKTVSSGGWSSAYGGGCQRSGKVDADLRFELRGMDPRVEHTVRFSPGVCVDVSLDDLTVEAGATQHVELDLVLGVRLRGRVRSAGDEKPEDVGLRSFTVIPHVLSSQSAGADEEEGDEDTVDDYVTVNEDGSFDARGIPAGRITLRATGTQRTPAVLDLGLLADGEVRDGLELTLGLGGRIGGRVVWPDGSPAVEAGIELLTPGTEDGPYLGRLVTDASGAFTIHGLEHGPVHVLAEAESREPVVKGKRRPPAWKARIDDVALGRLDLELVLQGGHSITGLVLDQSGAPVERFRVCATPKSEDELGMTESIEAVFSSKDGSFVLGGLHPGEHEVEVSALMYEPPPSIRIEVPAQLGPFTFVVTRNGSIAGFVQLPDGRPAARATLHIHSEGLQPFKEVDGIANPQGVFRIRNVSPGSLTVRAKLDGHAPSEAQPLHVGAGQSIENVRLILRTGGAIRVEVLASQEGESVSGREVHAYQVEGPDFLSGTTDSKGIHRFEHLAAGEYTVGLQPSPQERKSVAPDAQDPEKQWTLDHAMTKSAVVTVEMGLETHVVFGSDQRASVPISGRVRRGDEPAAFVLVRATPADTTDTRDAKHARTDAEGRYELAVPRAAKYRVQALPGGAAGMPISADFDVPEAGLTGADITLPKGRIAGGVHVEGDASTGWIHVTLERSETERAWSTSDYETWPDADFEFGDLAAGKYTLTVSVWLPNSGGQPRRNLGPERHEVELGEGQELTDLRIVVKER